MQTTDRRETIGIIGIGLMGAAMAGRLMTAGHAVAGHDVRADRCTALRDLGGMPCATPGEVLERCGRVVFSVMTTGQVAETLEGASGSLRPGHLVIDTTTGAPEQVAALGASLASRGVAYVDATIAGNSEQTGRGEVSALVGGDAADVARCRDLLECFTRAIHHLGGCGSGARMKLVMNMALGLNRAVLAETLSFAAALGIDAERAIEVLRDGPAQSRVMDTKGRKMLDREFAPQARLAQHLKDVRLMIEAGDRAGAVMPLTRLHEALLAALVAAGLGDLDNSAVIEAFAPHRENR